MFSLSNSWGNSGNKLCCPLLIACTTLMARIWEAFCIGNSWSSIKPRIALISRHRIYFFLRLTDSVTWLVNLKSVSIFFSFFQLLFSTLWAAYSSVKWVVFHWNQHVSLSFLDSSGYSNWSYQFCSQYAFDSLISNLSWERFEAHQLQLVSPSLSEICTFYIWFQEPGYFRMWVRVKTVKNRDLIKFQILMRECMRIFNCVSTSVFYLLMDAL